MLTAAFAGALAGLVHVLSGPDHLAAIAPLASDRRRAPWSSGALWGLGHSSGVLLVGLLALWLREQLPLDALSSWSERAVGVVLIGIGLWGFHRAFRRHVHAHPHVRASFLVGVLHGLAGSSHLIGILPALALPSQAAAIGYLGGYGAGTVAGMTLFAGGIGWIASRAREHSTDGPRWMLSACSALAVIVGAAWLVL